MDCCCNRMGGWVERVDMWVEKELVKGYINTCAEECVERGVTVSIRCIITYLPSNVTSNLVPI